jgi:hypothetical protein
MAMIFPNSQPPQVNLARQRFEKPFFVDMEAFFEFSFWITEELLDLEANHKLKAHRRKAELAAGANRAAIGL